MIDKTIEYAKKAWPYLWPWFLLPLVLFQLLEFVELLIFIGKIAVVSAFIMIVLSFFAGMTLAIVGNMPSYEVKDFSRFNFYKLVPTIRWGIEFVEWLIFEEKTPEGFEKYGLTNE